MEHGEISDKDAAYLIRLAQEVSPGFVLEIGTGRGETAAMLAHHAPTITVDPEKPAKHPGGAMFFWSTSSVFLVLSRGPVGLVFIDACHCAECVRNDLRWAERAIPGGYIALHDINQEGRPLGWGEHKDRPYGVLEALKDLDLDQWHEMARGDNLAVFQRKE